MKPHDTLQRAAVAAHRAAFSLSALGPGSPVPEVAQAAFDLLAAAALAVGEISLAASSSSNEREEDPCP